MSNCPLETCALVQSVRTAEPTSTKRAVLWLHPKKLEVVSQKPQESLSAFPSAQRAGVQSWWSHLDLRSKRTRSWQSGGSCFQRKMLKRAPSLPTSRQVVPLPRGKRSHLSPLVFTRNICSPLSLFSLMHLIFLLLWGGKLTLRNLSLWSRIALSGLPLSLSF